VQILAQLRSWLLAGFTIAALGYAGYLAYLVGTARPDPVYMEQKKEAARTSVVKIDAKPLEAASALDAVDGSTGVSAGHQPDPFSP
jgi:hypothetical protein